MTLLYLTFAILGIGLIIFIHEAGHFLAAKKVGVRVERFALGFDPTIRGRRMRFFSFRRGETEYVLGMIPFGGYVKMAGEVLPDPDSTEPPPDDELLAKSVGARALVFAAGAAMNILSAFVFFMIAFTLGVNFVSPKIGAVSPGGRAWEVGLRSGDTILEINGKPTVDFVEVKLASALSTKDEVLQLKVRRAPPPDQPDAEGEIVELSVSPRWNADQGFYQLGVEPAWSPVFTADPPPGSAAGKAGLLKGDRIVAVELAGIRLPPVNESQLMAAMIDGLAIFRGLPLGLTVQRGSEEIAVVLEPQEESDAEPMRWVQILVSSSGTIVKALAPDTQAKRFFRPGDRVLSIDGEIAGSLAWTSLVRRLKGDELEVEIESPDGAIRTERIERQEFLLWNLRNEIHWGSFGALVSDLTEDSPLRSAGVQQYDTITAVDAKVGGESVFTADEVESLLEKKDSGTVSLKILRHGAWTSVDYSASSTDELGVTWNTFPSIAVVGPGGPADNAGITPGSRIVGFGGTPIHSFVEFQKALRGGGGGGCQGAPEPRDVVEVAWLDASGRLQKGNVTVADKPLSSFGLAPCLRVENTSVRVGILESFTLGVQRTVNIGKQVFLTLRSLLRRDVSAKNLSGPVGITHIFTQAAQTGPSMLIYLMAMVSVNLGLLNLLPFPILDGGHLLFLLVEKIKGSPVNVRIQELATTVAFVLIITLFLFVTFHDVQRWLPW